MPLQPIAQGGVTTHKMRWILDRFRDRVGPNGSIFPIAEGLGE